jgi:hypothetical protein
MAKYERFIDRLFDDENNENITILDNDNKEVEFKQVGLVDYEGNYYALLEPVTPVEGVNEGELMVFLVDEEHDELTFIDNEEIIDGIVDFLDSLEDEEFDD